MKKLLLFIPMAAILVAFTAKQETGKWVAPESAKKIKNAVPTSAKSIKKGKAIFKERCVICHGESAKGDGPGGKSLNPKPANLTSSAVQSQTDGEIYWKISKGRNGMIKWGPILSTEDRWNLINYIRTLK